VLAVIDRRKFLKAGTSAALGLAGVSGALHESRGQATGKQRATVPRINRYPRLGRTELHVSDISLGSSGTSDPDVIAHAFDRGVNLFDSAESYRWGNAEEAIGKALKRRRDKVILTSKTKAGANDTRGEIMKSLEGSLRRLQTDHVDIYFNHSVNDVDRLRNQEWLEFTELAKRQGKIRFRGVSGHGRNLAESIDYAIDNDIADVILVAYNFSQAPDFYDKLRHTFHWSAIQPELPRILEKAKQKDVGVLAMKTLMGAKLNDMRPYEYSGGTFSQAAFRWVLSDPNVDALLVSMSDRDRIDEYVAASGSTGLSGYDRELLDRYAFAQAGRYCQPGCNICASVCPQKVEIAEVLRTRMYDLDYGDRELARTDYAALGEGAAACIGCTTQACMGSCPIGVPIAEFTRATALNLA
jgi:predicted aldo/keto reductase-like oxidoreductase